MAVRFHTECGEQGEGEGEDCSCHGRTAGFFDHGEQTVEDWFEATEAADAVEQCGDAEAGEEFYFEAGPLRTDGPDGEGEGGCAEEEAGVSFRSGEQNREERGGEVGVLLVDKVSDIVLPADGFFHADPTDGEFAVCKAGEQLGCSNQAGNEEGSDGGIDAQGNGCGGDAEADEDGDLMVSAEPGESEKEACPGGGADGVIRCSCGEEEAEDEGCPDEATDHLGPVVGAEETEEGEAEATADGGESGSAERAGEPVKIEGGDVVEEEEPPVESALAEPAATQGRGEEQPVEGVDYTGLTLAEEILPGPFIGAPKGEAALVPFAGLELKPGEDLAGEVMAIEPGVLVCEQDAPETEHEKAEEHNGACTTVG